MPIDPSIVMGVRPIPVQSADPMERIAKIMNLRNAQDQGDLQGLQLQQARQGLEDETAVRDAYKASGGDSQRLRALLAERGLRKPLMELDKADLETKAKNAAIDKDKAAAGKSTMDSNIARLERGAAIFGTAKDQQTYESALRYGVMTGVFTPDEVAKMPPQFNPQFISAAQAAGMTRAQQLADERAVQGQQITVRGQDMTAATAQRGQNMTDARAREQLAAGRWTNDLERGVQVNMQTGETRPITANGQPVAAPGKPLTESQGRGQMFGTRAAAADKIIRDLEGQYSVGGLTAKQGAESIPLIGGALGVAGNMALSANQQKAEQAQRDFVNAVLRQESGAVISPQEFENARKQYFPQPGDTQAVIDQKRVNRQTAIDGFKGMAGGAASRITEAEGDRTAKPTPERKPRGGLRGVLTPNPDGSFNYGTGE